MRLFFATLFIWLSCDVYGQINPFRFAFISDTHIGSPNGMAEEDLRRTVRDVNSMSDIAFAVLTGDITELGTNQELKLAKQILDSLNVPYHIIPGNHDTGWSESGGNSFTTTFGSDKFLFDYGGIRFIGCASGPYVRMSDGHVPRSAIVWMDSVLAKTPSQMPVIFLNHYPMDNGMDNWYEILDRLKKQNTLAILCGHGHANKALNFEDIPGVMGRSNLRAKAIVGGYNLVSVRTDSLIFAERTPAVQTQIPWTKLKVEYHRYDVTKKFSRPDFQMNETYSNVKPLWLFSSDANVISTPLVMKNLVVFGNHSGEVLAISIKDGSKKWSFKTEGGIFSSPATNGNDIVFGSADGYVYCLTSSGKLRWKFKAAAAVLGSPVINVGNVYVGGSDGHFRCINIKTGKEVWNFKGIEGPVTSKPLLYDNKIIFGAWDRHLYALSVSTGELLWKWNNGSASRNYSPAACIPVAADGIIYIVAPDRYISAIDATSGKTLWRNNDATIRESIGISADGKFIYGKTMQDTVVAYAASRQKQYAAWKMSCGFGYEHVPSMLIEKEDQVFFGTRSGVVYSIDPKNQKINWTHKIDNSMVNTVNVISKNRIVVATMDGKVALLVIND